MEQPANADIERFLHIFETLSAFEAQQLVIRNWGAFGPGWPRPDPSCVRVVAWLKDIVGDKPMRYPEAIDIPSPLRAMVIKEDPE